MPNPFVSATVSVQLAPTKADTCNLLDVPVEPSQFHAGASSPTSLTRPVTREREHRHLGTAGEGAGTPHICCQVPRLAGRGAYTGESLANRAKVRRKGHTAREACPQGDIQAQQDALPQQIAQHRRGTDTLNRQCGHRRHARTQVKRQSQHSIHMPKETCAPAKGARSQQEIQQQHRAAPEKAYICNTGPQSLEKVRAQHAAQPRPQPEVHMPECTCERSANTGVEQLQGLKELSVTAAFTGASVLITGATGYIGSLVRLSCHCPPIASQAQALSLMSQLPVNSTSAGTCELMRRVRDTCAVFCAPQAGHCPVFFF